LRAVIQRVSKASVFVDDLPVGEINEGICVLVGVATDDTKEDADYIAEKTVNMRIFEENDKCNLSLLDIGGEVLIISNFTVMGDCRKGRRPNFILASDKQKAEELYDYLKDKIKSYGVKVESGIFQAHMKVNIINDGPVTILLDSKKCF